MQSSNADMDRRKRFDQIVGVFHQDMYRYAAWLCRDKAIAEDVVQESMLRAWKSLDALRDDAAAKPWLLTIVTTGKRPLFRAQTPRDGRHRQSDRLAGGALLAEQPDDDLGDMRAAIYALEDDYREPLVLQVLMGYSTNEIAEQMDLKQGAVLTRLHRARAKLKDVMKEQALQ